MSDTLPEDPLTEYACWAIEVSECREALVTAGFTAKQAFDIVLAGVGRGWFDDAPPHDE